MRGTAGGRLVGAVAECVCLPRWDRGTKPCIGNTEVLPAQCSASWHAARLGTSRQHSSDSKGGKPGGKRAHLGCSLRMSMNLSPLESRSTGNSTFWPSGMVSTAMPSC